MTQTADLTMTVDSWRGWSAYEIAVQNGFSGTEAEWLQSLVGPQGEPAPEVRVNNRSAVDGNITVRGTDIYLQAGSATTLTQAIQANLPRTSVVNSLTSGDAAAALSAAQGMALKNLADGKMSGAATSLTLTAGGWSGSGPYSQSVTVNGATANNTVIVSPLPSSFIAYGKARVRASAQGANYLTFTAEKLPGVSLGVHALLMEL